MNTDPVIDAIWMATALGFAYAATWLLFCA